MEITAYNHHSKGSFFPSVFLDAVLFQKGAGPGVDTMAVAGSYISWRIREAVLPFVRVYGQWVDEHIIPMAGQLEAMADTVEQETYDELMSQPAGDDYSGDGSDEAEHAFDVGLSFYQNISDMYQGTLNLFSAGLFHVIEQQLADLTDDGAITVKRSETTLEKVTKWYQQHFQVDLTQFPSWALIDELRLLANTTKHAEGKSARDLRTIHPELFQSPRLRNDPKFPTPVFHIPLSRPLGGDGLYVTGNEFRHYHQAALDLFDWLKQHFERHGDEYYPR